MSGIVKHVTLNPLLTGGALLLLTQAPASVKEPILAQLRQVLSGQNISRVITALKWLAAAGAIRTAHTFLNDLAFNNFSLTSTKSDWDWPNEIAVITGTSSGFGKLLAQELSLKGIRIAAIDVSDPAPDLESNRRVTHYKCDVTNPDAVKDVAKRIQDEMGHPSILINNAGIANKHGILETSPASVKKIFDVNVISHWYLVQAFLPAMIEAKKGHIITMASIASFIAGAGFVDYCATKAAVYTFHDGLAAELRSIHNCPQIKTSIVHPGWANTPLIAEHVDALRKASTVIEPEVVSNAVVKQIMDCRSGQLIIMDNGRMISTTRAWPSWLSLIASRVLERGAKQAGALK